MKRILLILAFFLLLTQTLKAQSNVTAAYTNYKGWWDSSILPAIIPDTSHLLLGFKIGTNVYSTGVDDAKLTTHSISFSPQKFKALPVSSSISSQFIGVGYKYKGAGNVAPIPVNCSNVAQYLYDGTQGLDLGTALYNSTGTVKYDITNINPASIGDGVPDIIITQVGDPSTSTDVFSFTDASNTTIGSNVSVVFGSVTPFAKASWKFYQVSDCSYQSSVNGQRDIRMIAYGFSNFGINASNYSNIAHFVHKLSGTSDQAFIAYNSKSLVVLPVEFFSFTAQTEGNSVLLNWSTATERNNSYFTLQKSYDGESWQEVTRIDGHGNSNTENDYQYLDTELEKDTIYYRLFQTDFDGKSTFYPETISVILQNINEDDFLLYPNPAHTLLNIVSKDIDLTKFRIFDISGKVLVDNFKIAQINPNNYQIDISGLQAGVYFIQLGQQVKKLVVE